MKGSEPASFAKINGLLKEISSPYEDTMVRKCPYRGCLDNIYPAFGYDCRRQAVEVPFGKRERLIATCLRCPPCHFFDGDFLHAKFL